MGVHIFYVIACLPLVISIILYFRNKEIHIIESIILTAIGFIISGIFHWCAVSSMLSDTETLSGQVISATQHSAWVEAYDKAIYYDETYYVMVTRSRSVGTGKDRRTEYYTDRERRTREVFSHFEHRTRQHPESFTMIDSFGITRTIDKITFQEIITKFGKVDSFLGDRTNNGYRESNNRMVGGDLNDYMVTNVNKYIFPVTMTQTWENKAKASPSKFSFKKVPENVSSLVYEYPKNNNPLISDRLVGLASFNGLLWDQMNSRIGPSKKVNVIAVNFGINASEILADYQEAYWFGGKKNDVVICFGTNKVEGTGDISRPAWCKAFGWTEEKECLKNIENIIINNGIYNETIPLIEKELVSNYKIKDWSKFDYLTVEIPMPIFLICLISQIVVIIAWILISIHNGLRNDIMY